MINMKKENALNRIDNIFNNVDSPMYSHTMSSSVKIIEHSHDFYEITYVLHGTITHVINGEKQTFSAGELVFLRLKDKHYYIQNKEPASYRDLMFEKEFFETVCSFFDPTLLSKYNKSTLPLKISLSIEQMTALEQSIIEFSKITPFNSSEKRIKTKFIISQLLSYFHEQFSDKILSTQNVYPPIIVDILERMNMSEHYKESLSKLLGYISYDQSYLCRLFKKHIGVTMTEYFNNMKLNYVAAQLKLTQKTVTELSHEVGFSCVAHLNKLFLKNFGMTPSKYKKQMH